MKDDGGKPAIGPTARTLGARPGDIEVDAEGMVHPGTGGMSVSPGSPRNLPVHRRPAVLDGTGRDPVWKLNPSDLPSGLRYNPCFDESIEAWIHRTNRSDDVWPVSRPASIYPRLLGTGATVTNLGRFDDLIRKYQEVLSGKGDRAAILEDLVRNMVSSGVAVAGVQGSLELFRDRTNLSDEDENIVLETLDYLVGWCGPGKRIRPPE